MFSAWSFGYVSIIVFKKFHPTIMLTGLFLFHQFMNWITPLSDIFLSHKIMFAGISWLLILIYVGFVMEFSM